MLELQNISKSFPGAKALTDVCLTFMGGKVHALCGENGAGKSTLMNIISGNIQPDHGKIFIDGKETQLDSVAMAQRFGVGIVYQERSLVNALSVAENIFVTPPKNKYGLISFSKLFQQARELLDELQLKKISPRTIVEHLSAAEQQMIEIAKALATSPRLLILDEPTAALTHEDTATLFTIIRRLRDRGTSIIYISHRMREIREIADAVSILRDGVVQGTFAAQQISTDEIVSKMVGRELRNMEWVSHRAAETILKVDQVSGAGFSHVSFTLNRGEILGFAGLTGSGRTALALALFGDQEISSGTIERKNGKAMFSDPSQAIRNGFAYIPDDRKSLGLFMERNVSENIISAQLNGGMYDAESNDVIGRKYINALSIKASRSRQTVQQLSGGNQQKVVMAKWLNTDPDILIVNEPTQGVDVGAKQEIYGELRKLAAAGKSILLISSELPELLLLSDRIAVMCNGEIKTIIDHAEATEENITRMASDI